MKFCYYLFILSFFLGNSYAQENLVSNPSFEDTIQINGQPSLDTWQNNIGTPDYFSKHFLPPFDTRDPANNFRGGEDSQDGSAIFGFGLLDQRSRNTREYMQAELTQPLDSGEKYEIQFFISLADSFHLALSDLDIGIYFSDTLVANNFDHKVREFRPFYTSDSSWNASNKNGWEKFKTIYKAKGGERTMVIGCFKIDQDVTIDSVGNGGNFPFAFVGSFYFIDNISVRYLDTTIGIEEKELVQQINLYPNPVRKQFFVEYTGSEGLQFSLYNITGQAFEVFSTKTNNRYQIGTSHLAAGVYFLQLSDGVKQSTFKLIKQ